MKKMILGFALAISFLATGLSVWAQGPILRTDHPDRYTVVTGDTLWDISEQFLQNPWMWPEIWHVNPQINNPHLIYPGDVITLIYLDGRPRLTVERGEESRTFKASPGTDKLSPQVRIVPLSEAIPTIPLEAINAFLSHSRIVEPYQLNEAPYVLAGGRDRLVVGAGDFVYARGQFPAGVSTFGVYRQGDTYVDPDTNELLGVQALDIGTANLRSVDGDVGTMNITRTTEEVRIKDRLLTQEERAVNANFFPSAPEDKEVMGTILAVEGGLSQVGKLDVVVINRGAREGLVEGNVFAVYKRGVQVRDRVTNQVVLLPEERAGLLMVFRTFEKLSLGIVLEAELPLSVQDVVRAP